MSGMPAVFGSSAAVIKVTPSAMISKSAVITTEAVSSEKATPQKRRRLKNQTTEEVLTKKQMTTAPSSSVSIVGSIYGRLAERHVTEAEFKEWRARTQLEQKAAIKRATAELFLHNLTHEDNLEVQQAHLLDLEAKANNVDKENTYLKERVKKLEQEKSIAESSLNSLKAEHSKLEHTSKDKDKSLAYLTDSNTKLSREVNGWAEKLKKAEDADYTEGFHSYLKTFMATDPNYNWAASFGDNMVKWMNDFVILEAQAISKKNLQLEKECEKEKGATSISNT